MLFAPSSRTPESGLPSGDDSVISAIQNSPTTNIRVHCPLIRMQSTLRMKSSRTKQVPYSINLYNGFGSPHAFGQIGFRQLQAYSTRAHTRIWLIERFPWLDHDHMRLADSSTYGQQKRVVYIDGFILKFVRMSDLSVHTWFGAVKNLSNNVLSRISLYRMLHWRHLS